MEENLRSWQFWVSSSLLKSLLASLGITSNVYHLSIQVHAPEASVYYPRYQIEEEADVPNGCQWEEKSYFIKQNSSCEQKNKRVLSKSMAIEQLKKTSEVFY